MKLEGRKIMITGAAGFIGSHLADRLAESNWLLLVDDFSIGLRENLADVEKLPKVQIVKADVSHRDRMLELLDGIEVVFHLATSCLRTSINKPFLSHDINAGGTLNLCWAARERGVRRFVYVSSSEVYGTAQTAPMDETHPCHPMTIYGASKLAGELYALAYHRTYGMPVSVIRPFNTYGPREPYLGARAEVIPRFFLQLTAGRSPVVYGDGSQTRDFTFVADTVTGLIRAGECDDLVGDVVNIARGEEVSIGEVAQHMARLNGKSLGVEHAEPRPGDVHRHCADISKAQRLFGFTPTIGIEVGLSTTVDWFLAHRIAERVDLATAGTPNW